MKNVPHLYKCQHASGARTWFCSDGRWLGWGPDKEAAYAAWQARKPDNSCVHARPTRLQERRHKEASRLAEIYVGAPLPRPRPDPSYRLVYA